MELILQHFTDNQYPQKYQEIWCNVTYQMSNNNNDSDNNFSKTHVYYSYNVYGYSIHDIIKYCNNYLINAFSYFKAFSKRAISSLFYLRGNILYKYAKKRMYSIRKRNRIPQTIYGWITLSFSIARSLSRPFSRSLYKLDSKVLIFSSKYLYSIVYPKYLFNKIVTNIGITMPLAIRQSLTHCISALAQIFNASSDRVIWAPIDFSSLFSSLSSSLIKSALVEFARLVKSSLKDFERLFKSSLKDLDSSFKSSLKDFASTFKSPFVTTVSSKTAFFSATIIYAPLRLLSYIPTIISRICNRSIPKFTIMTHTILMNMQGAH